MSEIYGSLAGALVYHTARGNTAWTGSTDDFRLPALVRSSSAIDLMFGATFPGVRTGGRTQERAWPRVGVPQVIPTLILGPDEIPIEVEYATYEGGLRELAKPGSLMPDVAAGAPLVKRKRVEGVGEIEYAFTGPATPQFTLMQSLLQGVLFAQASSLVGSSYRR